MNTNNIGATQIVERFIKKEYVIIGTIEMVDIGEWYWVCYDASKHNEAYEIFSQGCATSRKDSICDVRSEYREQLKRLRNKNDN